MHYLPQQVMRASSRILAVMVMVVAVAGCQTTKEAAQQRILAWPEPPDEARFYHEQSLYSSSDIVSETGSQRLKRFATGQGQAGKPFDKPWGVAAFDHRIYVSDTISRKVHVYDLAGGVYSELGNKGAGSLAKPLGVATDASGKVYVCDGSGKRVVVFDAGGNYLLSIGKQGDLDRPSSVAVNREGTLIYVVDTGGVESDKHHVVVFNAEGEKLFIIGTRGDADGEFNLPVGAAVAPNGDLYVVDGGNFRIQGFDANGKFKLKFGDVGRRSGQFARPKDIAIDNDGNLYVTDSSFANFQIFNANGELLLFIGERNPEGMQAQFMLPSGITVDKKDGRVYVVDQFFRKLEVFRPASTPLERPKRVVQSADSQK